jgi:hypothetical protein
MAESTLSVTYHELLRELGRFLGWGRNPGRWKEDDKSDAEDCIKSGLRQFYIPLPVDGKSHRWSFLDPLQTFSAVEPYSTGTVTIVNGVVTLAGGTFPSWAASGDLRFGSVNYSVNTRDTGTQVTLDDLTLDGAAGSSYSVVQQVYDLPADFGGLIGPIFFRAGSTNFKTRVAQRSDIEVRKMAAEVHLGEPGEPSYYAVRPKTYSGGATAGPRFELVFDRPTDAAYTFEYRYQIDPNTIDFTNIYPYGGAKHSETIIESVLAAGEIRFHDDANGPHRQRFLELLKASIEKDRAEFTPDSLGVDYGDRFSGSTPRQVRTYFEGVEIA